MHDDEQGLNDGGGSGSPVGPIFGTFRLKYSTILDYTLRESFQPSPGGITVFINMDGLISRLMSSYSDGLLTEYREAVGRRQFVTEVAAEVLDLAGHYRNYLWRTYAVPVQVFLPYSFKPCSGKRLSCPAFKERLYGKMASSANSADIESGMDMARLVSGSAPGVHVVDTGVLDPGALPWLVPGAYSGQAAILGIGSWGVDLQMVPELGATVLTPFGDKSLAVTEEVVIEALVKAKTNKVLETLAYLAPRHLLYLLAMGGDEKACIPGIPRVGYATAAKRIARRVAGGGLPPDRVSLRALLEDGDLSKEEAALVMGSWKAACHSDHAAFASQADIARIECQLTDSSSLELEEANARYFGARPVNLDMLLAGETRI